jgi:FMN phosphatase YigB (HAD superfamily)
MNKIILSDCDEVILNFVDPFETWIKDVKGLKPEKSLREVYKPEIWLGITREEGWDLLLEYSINYESFGDLPPYFDALEYINKLNEYGYRLDVITACSDHPIVVEKRWKNLKKYFGNAVRGLHCVGVGQPKLETLKKYPENLIWVEDSHKHARAGIEAKHKSILINRTHNLEEEAHEGVIRVDSWKEIFEIIMKK